MAQRAVFSFFLIAAVVISRSSLLLAEDLCSSQAATMQTIEHLFRYVTDSKLTFIRNGEEHDAKAAADHMRSKYDYFKLQIHTPEDFIEKCAARSLMSGKPYVVRLPDHSTREVQEWLSEELKRFRDKGCTR